MIVAIEQITWNHLHWLKLLHASYIFLLRQAGKSRVFYSTDKCFETGADPLNIFDKQILKVWMPSLWAFYCVILRATFAWCLKACATGSHLKLRYVITRVWHVAKSARSKYGSRIVPQEVTQPGRNVQEEIAFLLPFCGLLQEINHSAYDRKHDKL